MSKSRPPTLTLALLSALAAAGCSSGDGAASPGTGGSGGSQGDTDAALPDAQGDGDAFDAVSPGCPSHILCGSQGTCCGAGQECVEGDCADACASAVRCAGTCCAATQVCLAAACVTPGASCGDSFDCEETEFCEPTLGKCLPQPPDADACQYKPGALPLEPVIEWSWTGSAILPDHDQIQSLPLVADVDGDASPDVVVATFFRNTQPANLRLLDGRDGTEKWPASAEAYLPENAVCPSTNQAIGDIDGDGKLEIVSLTFDNGLMAVGNDGSILWKATMPDGVTPYHGAVVYAAYPCNLLGSVAVADMDADGKAESVIGGVIFDSTGRMIAGAGRDGAGVNGIYGPVSIIADVDGDGVQDVVSGNAAFALDGSVLWDNGLSDGYPAIADLDGDGTPELVVTSLGTVRVQRPDTGEVLAQLAVPGGGPSGGPPTVADFDGDGQMDFAAAGANLYSAFSYSSSPAPTITVKWSTATYDVTPGTTGSSVFDFDGDGAAEVVYNDELRLLIFDGKDGSIRFEEMSTSLTGAEYPVVVDVDGDNNSELLTISADYGLSGRHGLFVYGDANDRWVRTRKIWNQHSYHITNIDSDGTLPKPEQDSWAQGAPNNYRVSTQGAGVFNAPDLKVDLEVSTETCPAGLTLRARVKNEGSLGAPAGVTVKFYEGTSAAGTLLHEAQTQQPLLPGQSEVVEYVHPVAAGNASLAFYVAVDGNLGAGVVVNECDTDNNGASAAGLGCDTLK